MNPLVPLPGTELYELYKEQLIVPRHSAYSLWDLQHCVLQPESMTLKSFYRRMNLLYLATANPFRVRRVPIRRKVPIFTSDGFKFWKGLMKTYYEMLFAYRHHKNV